MNKKWLILFGYIAVAALLIWNKEALIHWLKESGSSQIFLVIAALTLLAVVPAIPFPLIGGIIGIKYGPVVGGLLNVTASTIAALLFFLLIRSVFKHQARMWLSKFKRTDRFTALFEKNAFMAVLIARLIPILPAPAVNGYAAVSSMNFRSYAVATLLGKIPAMFVFAWIGDQLFVDMTRTFVLIGGYAGFIVVVYAMYRKYLNRAAGRKIV